jgi:hypothetical protein
MSQGSSPRAAIRGSEHTLVAGGRDRRERTLRSYRVEREPSWASAGQLLVRQHRTTPSSAAPSLARKAGHAGTQLGVAMVLLENERSSGDPLAAERFYHV